MTVTELQNFLCSLMLDELDKYGGNKCEMYRRTGIPTNTIGSLMDGRSIGICRVCMVLDALGYELEIKKK